jgi:hypothetical protein
VYVLRQNCRAAGWRWDSIIIIKLFCAFFPSLSSGKSPLTHIRVKRQEDLSPGARGLYQELKKVKRQLRRVNLINIIKKESFTNLKKGYKFIKLLEGCQRNNAKFYFISKT